MKRQEKYTMATKENKKRLVLLDAQAILHRAYHALPDFSSSKGEPTGALYGLSLMLLKIINELKPDFIVACFDVKDPTYRHIAYEAYKAGRKKTEDDLIFQIDKSKEIFESFGVPVFEKSGFEADDLLGTITERLKNDKGVEIVIASGDMDTMQLIEKDRVKVYTLKKGIKDTIIYDEKTVKERFGFEPELLPDYKGLRGDPSDNIIGIKGIGEKTATDLIINFGTIEEIYKKLKKDEKSFEEKGIKKRIIDLLKENEEEAIFSKTLATIQRNVPIDFELPKNWTLEDNKEKIMEIFSRFEFRALRERINSSSKGEIAAEQKKPETGQLLLEKSNVSDKDLKETSIALWILDSNLTNSSQEDILRFAETRDFRVAQKKVFQELEKRNLKEIFEKIEKPLIPVIERIEKRGIKVDDQFLKNLSKEYHKKLSELEKNIWLLCGQEFNLNSPKQLGKVLFEDLEIKAKNQKKTSTGAKSTRESELEKMKDLHPAISLILEYRELQKLLSTYIDNIPGMLAEDGRLHAKFLQAGTTTGRMSSQNPNLQNIPIKSDLGKKIRDAFVAEKSFSLAAFDYSQIELRVAAFLSKDEKLLKIFKNGEDVHSAVASAVFNVPLEKVDSEMRRRAKVINFGIIYGMGVNALRANLGTTKEEAQNFLDGYFKNFSTLASYLEGIKKSAERTGFTETFFSRRRYFPAIKSKIPYIKASAERMAVNAPLQGTSADIIKLAMIGIEEYLKKNNLENDVFIVLQIHDELVFEISDKKLKEVLPKIEEIMEGVLDLEETLGVPLAVNGEVGKNWGAMESIN